jgi:phage host-nuclease inhibitor protein Gam
MAKTNPHTPMPKAPLKITSVDALEAAVADVVRRRIELTAAVADKDAECAGVEKAHQARIMALQEQVAEGEAEIQVYCEANRAALFTERKSRETPLAVFGFELTPWRVESSSKKLTWAKVVERLQRLVWGDAYLRFGDPKVDKDALLRDREQLNPEQLTAAGIRFDRDEQFFLRPKPETAKA